MADEKITQLAALTTPATEDLLAIVDDPAGTPETKKITILNLLKLFLSSVTMQVLAGGASGTYTPTSGAKKILVIAVGGGGAGGDITAADECSGGGGGGGCCIKLLAAASYSYAVGNTATGAGNNTTFDTLTASGGAIGVASGLTTTLGTSGAGGAGGAATNGDINVPGEPGERGLIFDGTNGYGGRGGRSFLGMGGARTASASAGNVGTNYGGGGSGAHTADDTNRNGGDGVRAVLDEQGNGPLRDRRSHQRLSQQRHALSLWGHGQGGSRRDHQPERLHRARGHAERFHAHWWHGHAHRGVVHGDRNRRGGPVSVCRHL